MRLERRGSQRDCGDKSLITHIDEIYTLKPDVVTGGAVVRVQALRGRGSSSYWYMLQLNPEEILECILKANPAKIAEAMPKLKEYLQRDLPELLPELQKQLTLGFAASLRGLEGGRSPE